LLALLAIAFTSSGFAQNPMVGGHDMSPMKNIIQNAGNSNGRTTLVAAVKAGGLVDALSGPGPFSVFSPTNQAFAKLPPGIVENLLRPENKDHLTKILAYHVVAGRLTSNDLRKMISGK
jgi:uncharacterized surface protein with fasciclin (FAS1) repeats